MEKLVLEFHKKYGHLISETPTLDIPDKVKFLRCGLIMEEVQETLEAMGFQEKIDGRVTFDPTKQNLTEIADGIADSIYVLLGTAISYGIPISRIFREVHNSNMTKTPIKAVAGQKYGTKTPKGADFIQPDITGILSNPDKKTQNEENEGPKLTKQEAITLANITKDNIEYARSQNNTATTDAFMLTMKAVCEVMRLREKEEEDFI